MKSKVLVATTLLLLGTVTSAYSGVCESANSAVAGTTAAAAALWATPPAVVATTGTAALEHSSGSYILSSVGIGGTGYIAETLASIGATALGIVSAPEVAAAAAAVVVVGGATLGTCYLLQ